MLTFAKDLGEAFELLFPRFCSSERRDRLIGIWNDLKFKTVKAKLGATNQSALKDLVQIAQLLQFQLGEAYQDDKPGTPS